MDYSSLLLNKFITIIYSINFGVAPVGCHNWVGLIGMLLFGVQAVHRSRIGAPT